jgi:trans-aconitate methyltransferase
VAQLRALLARESYATVCEIGTGNGLFLEYLSRELTGVRRFVGIDLNCSQIERNREVYAGSRLEFECSEIATWMATGVTGPTIFLAAGTLECFTQPELVEFLGLVRRLQTGAAIALCEPVNIDLATTTASKARGSTMYSHNYPHLLRSAGFVPFETQIDPIDPAIPNYLIVNMVATTESAPAFQA